MKSTELTSKIILPPIVLIIFIYIFSILEILNDISLLYYPISFGLVLGLFNWKLSKFSNKIILLIIFSIIICIVSFFIGFFSLGVYNLFENTIKLSLGEDDGKMWIIIISTCLIAPIALFQLLKLIFKFKKDKFNFFVKVITIILLIIQFLCFYKFSNNKIENNSFYNLISPFTFWQFIMIISLQLQLYHEEVKMLFKKE